MLAVNDLKTFKASERQFLANWLGLHDYSPTAIAVALYGNGTATMPSLCNLPYGVLMETMWKLEYNDVLNMCKVCKNTNVCQDIYFWKKYLQLQDPEQIFSIIENSTIPVVQQLHNDADFWKNLDIAEWLLENAAVFFFSKDVVVFTNNDEFELTTAQQRLPFIGPDTDIFLQLSWTEPEKLFSSGKGMTIGEFNKKFLKELKSKKKTDRDFYDTLRELHFDGFEKQSDGSIIINAS